MEVHVSDLVRELAHLIDTRQHPIEAAEAIIARYTLIRQENTK